MFHSTEVPPYNSLCLFRGLKKKKRKKMKALLSDTKEGHFSIFRAQFTIHRGKKNQGRREGKKNNKTKTNKSQPIPPFLPSKQCLQPSKQKEHATNPKNQTKKIHQKKKTFNKGNNFCLFFIFLSP